MNAVTGEQKPAKECVMPECHTRSEFTPLSNSLSRKHQQSRPKQFNKEQWINITFVC